MSRFAPLLAATLLLLAASAAESAESWTNLAKLPQPQCEAATAVLDGKVYVLGGWGTNSTESATASPCRAARRTPAAMW